MIAALAAAWAGGFSAGLIVGLLGGLAFASVVAFLMLRRPQDFADLRPGAAPSPEYKRGHADGYLDACGDLQPWDERDELARVRDGRPS